MFCSIQDFTFLMTDTKIKGQVSFESSEKKEIFVNRDSKLMCLRACLHERDRERLIDKPGNVPFSWFFIYTIFEKNL